MKVTIEITNFCCGNLKKAIEVNAYTPLISMPSGVPVTLWDNRVGAPIETCPFCSKDLEFVRENNITIGVRLAEPSDKI